MVCSKVEETAKFFRWKRTTYGIVCLFGITVPVNHDRISSFIEGELNNMDWYIENEHDEIARSIPEYIIGYALFHYAPPKPDLDLLQLFLRILNEPYFVKLGFKNSFRSPKGKYNRRAIKKAIYSIINENDEHYPFLSADVGVLKYGSHAQFARSYLVMIQRLDMTRKE